MPDLCQEADRSYRNCRISDRARRRRGQADRGMVLRHPASRRLEARQRDDLQNLEHLAASDRLSLQDG